jgi:hypothetical protein
VRKFTPTIRERSFITALVLHVLGEFGEERGSNILMHASLLGAMIARMKETLHTEARKEGQHRRKKG